MSESEPLLRGAFMHHQGVLALPGVLTLTQSRLTFEQDRLERLAGAAPWSLQLHEVRSVVSTALSRAVLVHSAHGTMKLSGRGAPILRDRLQALLDESKGVGSTTRYEPGERVLLYGGATVFRRSWLDATGLIELTTSRLRFLPSFAGRLFGPDARLELKLGDIQDARLVGVRRILELETRNGVHRIGGPLTSPILTTLLGLREEIPGVARSAVYSAALRRGRLAHPGQVVVSPARIRFVTTGMLDALVGAAEDIDLPLADVVRVDAAGRALELHAGASRTLLEVADAGQVLDMMTPLLARAPATDEPQLSEQGAFSAPEETERICAPWAERMASDVLAQRRMAGPCLLVIPRTRLKRFVVVQTDTAVVAVPAVGPKRDGSAIIIRYSEGLEPPRSEGVADVLELRTPNIAVQFLARTGSGFARAFWRGVPSQKPQLAPESTGPGTSPSVGVNRRDSYRVVHLLPLTARVSYEPVPDAQVDGASSLDVSLVNTSAEGLGLALPNPLPVGTELDVELNALPEEEEPFQVRMQVVHIQQTADDVRPYYHGLRVVDQSAPRRSRLQRMWANFRHEEAARRNRVNDELQG